MRGVWLALLFALLALPAVATQSTSVTYAPSGAIDARPLTRHLGAVILHMDRGPRSREYRESLDYLRPHAAEAVAELSGALLREPGSFRKWQITYLVGELGDESGLALLRTFMDQPMPQVRPAREGSHATDLLYTEELASRVQAVSSTARIASLRPELHDRAVESLIAVAQQVPMLEDTAMFELRKLLGPEFQALRRYFGPEDARHFEPFMPPPQWQGLLSRRMQKHRRQEEALRETRKPLCRAK